MKNFKSREWLAEEGSNFVITEFENFEYHDGEIEKITSLKIGDSDRSVYIEGRDQIMKLGAIIERLLENSEDPPSAE